MSTRKKICIAFLGNPFHDSRITNLKTSLEKINCDVKVIGFDWTTPNFQVYRDDDTVVFKLSKTKFSILFYAKFKMLLLKELFRNEADIFFAEEIFSLPFVKIRTIFGKGKIYYNSRELYAFLGGLRNRKYLQMVFKLIERLFIKRVDLVLTTGEMDSEFLHNYYGINNTLVIRNIPKLQTPDVKIDLHQKLNLDRSKKILLYQGVMIDGRGIELIIDQLEKIDNTVLVLLGDGERRKKWEQLALEKNVESKIYFLGTIPQNDLINYTAAADVGVCLIENISISYYHALPNKLFEYIMAGIPVISSSLPQMKRVVEQYNVGVCVDLEKTTNVSNDLNEMLSDESKLKTYKDNCKEAAQELNWDVEFEKVKDKLLG